MPSSRILTVAAAALQRDRMHCLTTGFDYFSIPLSHQFLTSCRAARTRSMAVAVAAAKLEALWGFGVLACCCEAVVAAEFLRLPLGAAEALAGQHAALARRNPGRSRALLVTSVVC